MTVESFGQIAGEIQFYIAIAIVAVIAYKMWSGRKATA